MQFPRLVLPIEQSTSPARPRKKSTVGLCSGEPSRIYENGRQNVSPGGQHMSVESLEELFLDELKDLYSAEKQITKALPKMVKAATAPKLKNAFQSHLEETNGQVERLETIFEMLKKRGTGKTCEGMKGVLSEGAEVLQETKKGDLRLRSDNRGSTSGALRDGRIRWCS